MKSQMLSRRRLEAQRPLLGLNVQRKVSGAEVCPASHHLADEGMGWRSRVFLHHRFPHWRRRAGRVAQNRGQDVDRDGQRVGALLAAVVGAFTARTDHEAAELVTALVETMLGTSPS